MQGIYRIINTKYNKVFGYFASDNLEEAVAEFEKNKYNHKRVSRMKNIEYFHAEIVEVTDDINVAMAKYLLPQISRVKYDTSVYAYEMNKKYTRKLNGVVDWLVTMFPDNIYSFTIRSLDERFVEADVLKNHTLVEQYRFSRAKEPGERILF